MRSADGPKAHLRHPVSPTDRRRSPASVTLALPQRETSVCGNPRVARDIAIVPIRPCAGGSVLSDPPISGRRSSAAWSPVSQARQDSAVDSAAACGPLVLPRGRSRPGRPPLDASLRRLRSPGHRRPHRCHGGRYTQSALPSDAAQLALRGPLIAAQSGPTQLRRGDRPQAVRRTGIKTSAVRRRRSPHR
jgi:hypothetical protein